MVQVNAMAIELNITRGVHRQIRGWGYTDRRSHSRRRCNAASRASARFHLKCACANTAPEIDRGRDHRRVLPPLRRADRRRDRCGRGNEHARCGLRCLLQADRSPLPCPERAGGRGLDRGTLDRIAQDRRRHPGSGRRIRCSRGQVRRCAAALHWFGSRAERPSRHIGAEAALPEIPRRVEADGSALRAGRSSPILIL